MSEPIQTKRQGYGALILLILLAVGFAVVLLWLLNLRLSRGDSYPPYSSLRSDPLGSRVLYEALSRLEGLSVERNMRRLQFMQADDRSVLMFLGLRPKDLSIDIEDDERKVIDRLLDQGCSLVVALQPEFRKRDPEAWRRPFAHEQEKNENPPSAEPVPKEGSPIRENEKRPPEESKSSDETEVADARPVIPDFFGLRAVQVARQLEPRDQVGSGNLADLSLPAWRGSHALELDEDAEWSALASANGQTTAAVLHRGRGRIIVVTDSFPFSNEAQVSARHSDWILALLGDAKRVVFDETHLQVVQEPGLVGLMRSYSLHGILVGAGILFILLVWQGAGSLLPIDEDRDLGVASSGHVAGRDSSDGLISLLEVGLTPRDLLDECLKRHAKSSGLRPIAPDVLDEAHAIAKQTRTGQLAADHTRIVQLLTQRPKTNPASNHGPH